MGDKVAEQTQDSKSKTCEDKKRCMPYLGRPCGR